MKNDDLRKELNIIFPNFKNLRDISYIPNKFSNKLRIRENLIYRSSSLAKYKADLVKNLIQSLEINFIIDLRDKNELKTYKFDEILEYSDIFSKTYVKNIPLNPFVNTYIENESMKNLYYAIIKNYTDQIGLIFNLISDAMNNKLIIHCQAGVDRTGIIIALLYELLEIDREIIIIDYIASRERNINVDNLTYMLDAIDNEFGGIDSYLSKYCKVSQNAIMKIKNQLVKEEI